MSELITQQEVTPEHRFNAVFQSGKLVQLHIGKWSMACRLSKDDLEIEEDLPSIFKLGHKMLIDEEELRKFNKIENKARAYLEKSSLPFPIAHAHFVPKKKLLEVFEQLNTYRNEFFEAVNNFLDRYEDLKQKMFEDYPELQEKLLPFYPPVHRLRGYYIFETSMFEISVPKKFKKLGYEEAEAKEAAMERVQQKFENELTLQQEQAQAKINQFLNDAVVSLRGEIIETFENITNKIRNRELVTKTNLKSIASVIDRFRDLNFINDIQVNQRLEEVSQLLTTEQNYKDDNDARNRLANVLNATLETARDISDVDTLTGEYVRKISL